MKPKTAFFLVIFLALALRVIGVNFGLPFLHHQDEPIVVNHALAYSSGDLNPHFFKIPPLLSYVLFGVYGLFYGLVHFLRGWSPDQFAALFFRDPSWFYLLGRLIFGVILGTLSVAILYRLATKYFSEKIAAVSALFFAGSYFHVRDSHYVYADIPMILAMLLFFLALAEYQTSGQRAKAFGAGIWLGVAVAFKYIAAPVVVSLFWVLGRKPKLLFGALAVSAVAYIFLNPYSLLDWIFFWKEIFQQAQAETPAPYFFHHLVYSLFEGQGVLIICSGIVGSFILFKKKPELRHLVVFVFLWYFMTARFSQSFERYVMPMAPFLCFFSAFALNWAVERFIQKKFQLAVFAAFVVFFLTVPLSKSVYLDWLVMRPDTRVSARAWILENLPEKSVVALNQPFFGPQLTQTDEQLAQKQGRISSDDPQDKLKQKKLRLIQEAAKGQKRFEVFYLRGHSVGDPSFLTWSPWMDANERDFERLRVRYVVRYPTAEESKNLLPLLQRHFRLLKIFSPYRSDTKIESSDPYGSTGLPFLSKELFSRKAPGPYLEIYEWLE